MMEMKKMTTDVTHEYDGGSSRASLNATSGLLEFLPLEKTFGIILGFLPDHTEIRKEVYCKHC